MYTNNILFNRKNAFFKIKPNTIPFSIITSYKYFQYFTKHTIFSKMHSNINAFSKMHSQNRGSKHKLRLEETGFYRTMVHIPFPIGVHVSTLFLHFFFLLLFNA